MPKLRWMLLAALPVLAWAQAPVDFSGTWKLDTLRSRYVQIPAPKSVVLHIDQHASTVAVKMTAVTHAGETNEDFALNAAAPNPSVTWDGDHLVLEYHRDDPSGPVLITRRLKRGDKGKIMTSVLTMKDKSGLKTVYEFYEKE